MKEQNKETLNRAIRRLPQYNPPDQLWLNIGQELDYGSVRSAVETLPEYEPPEEVWTQIASELDEDQLPAKRIIKTRSLWLYMVATAAGVALLIGLFGWPDRDGIKISTQYAQEMAIGLPVLESEDADQSDFALVDQFCQSGLIACKQPEVIYLREELLELTQARDVLKIAITPHTTDKQLLAQLTEIELARSEVVKKIMEKI